MKRLSDILMSAAALAVLAPVLLAAAVAVRLSSPGPILFRAARVGRGGTLFTMLKFRTMHQRGEGESWTAVTAGADARVFPAGRVLRKFKIDELPQLINIIRGDMSVIGPRPEDPGIVNRCYGPEERRTLTVRPGLASRGSLYYYTHLEALIPEQDTEHFYATRILPVKARLDLIDIDQPSSRRELVLIAQTLFTLVRLALGQRRFPEPPELAAVLQDLPAADSSVSVTSASPSSPTDCESVPPATRRNAA